jgi:hypothetical protein
MVLSEVFRIHELYPQEKVCFLEEALYQLQLAGADLEECLDILDECVKAGEHFLYENIMRRLLDRRS